MDHLVSLTFAVVQYATGKGGKQTKQYGNGKEKYRKPACSLSQTDDRCRCGGRGQGELARRGAYGYYRSRPDSREHEQKPSYKSRDKRFQKTFYQPCQS